MKKKIPLFVASTLAVNMLGDIKKEESKETAKGSSGSGKQVLNLVIAVN